jgi:hypothetical protein
MTLKEHSFKVPKVPQNFGKNSQGSVRNNILAKNNNNRNVSSFNKGQNTIKPNNAAVNNNRVGSNNNNNIGKNGNKSPNVSMPPPQVNVKKVPQSGNPTPTAMLSRSINGRFTPKSCDEVKNDGESPAAIKQQPSFSSPMQAPCSSVNFYPSGCPGGRMF